MGALMADRMADRMADLLTACRGACDPTARRPDGHATVTMHPENARVVPMRFGRAFSRMRHSCSQTACAMRPPSICIMQIVYGKQGAKDSDKPVGFFGQRENDHFSAPLNAKREHSLSYARQMLIICALESCSSELIDCTLKKSSLTNEKGHVKGAFQETPTPIGTRTIKPDLQKSVSLFAISAGSALNMFDARLRCSCIAHAHARGNVVAPRPPNHLSMRHRPMPGRQFSPWKAQRCKGNM